ncbi:MAG: TRAP transporter large permease, partial [Desulfovibrio sp.]
TYGLTVIPLFILMGQICFYSGVNKRLYKAAYAWLGHRKGGLSIATILACAGFSAISGSNTATAATMSTVALPEMRKYNYDPILSTSAVAIGSTLGVVIPPSVVLIIIGLQNPNPDPLSIGDLFWGAVGPGLLLTILFILTVAVLCRKNPHWGPAGPKATWNEKMSSLLGSMETIILFAVVMAGFVIGLYSPSEVGAAGSLIALALYLGRMAMERLIWKTATITWKNLLKALSDTVRVSCMILMIVTGAVIFGRFLAITRLPFAAADWVSALPIPDPVILILICLIYVVGGMVMDALALLLITIPIFFPLADAMGYDPIWFGVLVTVVTTMGAVTPPVGVNTFIVASMAPEASMPKIFKGVSLFLIAYVLCVTLMMCFPDIVLLLPNMLR